MSKDNTEVMIIGKEKFTVKYVNLPQESLNFYPENPRVYSILNISGEEPSQEEIEEHMCNNEHVKELKNAIESNGGLIEPVIVRDGDNVVLEGNSRLAAYRILADKDPIKWGKIRCILLPSDISEKAVFSLLGQRHLNGQKEWEPFEQATYLYRRHLQTKIPIQSMAEELGLSKSKAQSMIDVVEFMIKYDDNDKRHWSHYWEYLKNNNVKKFRETNPDLDNTIAKSIKGGEIKDAKDMRKLAEVAKVGDKQSKRIMQNISTGVVTIYDGHEQLLESGKLDDVVKKLKRFRDYIADGSFEKQLKSSKDTYNQAKFEIEKIIKRLYKIQEKMKNNE